MGISLQEVIDNSLISEDILNNIPHTCTCGAPIEFTDSLRQIYCSNSKCFYKIAARLEAMAKTMKADGWGESTCIQVCQDFKLVSPYQVFLLEEYIKRGGTSTIPAFQKKLSLIHI